MRFRAFRSVVVVCACVFGAVGTAGAGGSSARANGARTAQVASSMMMRITGVVDGFPLFPFTRGGKQTAHSHRWHNAALQGQLFTMQSLLKTQRPRQARHRPLL